MAMNQTCYAINGNKGEDYFAHQLSLIIISKLKKEAVGATFEALVTKNFDELLVVKPADKVIRLYEERIKSVYDFILTLVQQNQQLSDMKSLLLSKLATLEN